MISLLFATSIAFSGVAMPNGCSAVPRSRTLGDFKHPVVQNATRPEVSHDNQWAFKGNSFIGTARTANESQAAYLSSSSSITHPITVTDDGLYRVHVAASCLYEPSFLTVVITQGGSSQKSLFKVDNCTSFVKYSTEFKFLKKAGVRTSVSVSQMETGSEHTIVVDAVEMERLVVPIKDGGFERPPTLGQIVAPNRSSRWEFSHGAGVCRSGQYLCAGTDVSEGMQAAFLPMSASIKTKVQVPVTSTYRITVDLSLAKGSTQSEVDVTINGIVVGAFTVTSTTAETFATAVVGLDVDNRYSFSIKSVGPDSALVDNVHIERLNCV